MNAEKYLCERRHRKYYNRLYSNEAMYTKVNAEKYLWEREASDNITVGFTIMRDGTHSKANAEKY